MSRTNCKYKEANGSCSAPVPRDCGHIPIVSNTKTPVDDLSNYGKNKAGEPEKADNITRFTCYKCLHTVKYLFEDGRCKDCTGFTVEIVRG